MKIISTLLLATITAVLLSTPTAAQTINEASGPRDNQTKIVSLPEEESCSGLVVFGFQSGYPLQDLGIDASDKKAVSQNMFLVRCGHFSIDVWTSAQLSGGTYGHRGSGDEWDLEMNYANSVETPLGKFNYEFYAAYYALDLGEGLRDSEDDYVQIYGELARTFQVGRFQVTPFGRYIHLFAIGDFDDLDFIRAGVRIGFPFSVPLVGNLNGYLDASHTSNLNASGVVTHQEVWRGELGVSRDLGLGWSVTLGTKFTEFVGATPLMKLTYSF